MSHRFSTSMGVLAAAALLSLSSVAGQAPKKPAPPIKTTSVAKTPWGDPDLQGVWNDATSTPLQRPGGVGAKDILSDEEAAEFQEQLAHDLTRDRRDGGADADVNRAYNEHWTDSRLLQTTTDHRT